MAKSEKVFEVMAIPFHQHTASEQHGSVLVWQLMHIAPLSRDEFDHVKAATGLWLNSLERQVRPDLEPAGEADKPEGG